MFGVNVRARISRPARAKGFCPLGFLELWHRSAAPGRPAQGEGKSAMTVLTWSDERVEQLKKLWESGLSASQIAAELGNVTRNAVIGKVHRLGLSGRAKSPSSAAPRARKAEFLLLGGKAPNPPPLLRPSLAHRLPAGKRPPPPAAEADAVRVFVIAR